MKSAPGGIAIHVPCSKDGTMNSGSDEHDCNVLFSTVASYVAIKF